MIRPVEPQHAAKPVVEWFITLSDRERIKIATKAGVPTKKAKARKKTVKKASKKAAKAPRRPASRSPK